MRSYLRTAIAAGMGAAVSAAVTKYAATRPIPSWERSSFSGKTVSLSEGAAAAAGVTVGSLCPGGMGATAAIVSGAIAGAVDDHFEDRFPAKGKGFSGHLGALKQGKITSGLFKIGVIGAGAAISAATIARADAARGDVRGASASFVRWVGRTATIAGTANIINLLDLRPGRAIKASMVVSSVLLPLSTAKAPLAATIGAGAACLPRDLEGTTMLGDLGANAMGGALGYGLACARPVVMWTGLAGVVALTAASEKYSFSKVIEDTPVLAYIDGLGRR